MDARKPGERTGSRPKPPKAGARSASLEPGRAPGYPKLHSCFPIDQRVFRSQAVHQLGGPRQFVGEICAVTAPKRNSLALLSGDDPVAVMFHLVQPLWPRGRPGD